MYTGAFWAVTQPERKSRDGFLEEVTVLKVEWGYQGRRKEASGIECWFVSQVKRKRI